MQWRWKTTNSTPRSNARMGKSRARQAQRRWIPVVEAFEDRTLLSLSVGTSFTGATIDQSGFIPPDTQGAAGPTQVVETLNGVYSVYSKTGAVVTQTSLDSFFNTALAAGGGGTVTKFSFDPRIAYDEQSQRFFVAGDDNSGQANSFIVAVSNSSDATAGWKAWKVASDPTAVNWMDYPTLGLNHDGVYLGGNMFPISGTGNTFTDLLVIPKADLTSGVGVTHATLFANLDPNTTGFTPRPVLDLNSSEGQPETIISDYDTPGGVAKISLITGTVTAPVLDTNPSEGDLGGGFFTVPARNGPDPAPQLGDTHTLETGDTRFSSHLIVQGTNIWAVQGVDIGGRAAIAWYRIDYATGTLVENGTIADSSLSYYYPSIAVNEAGDIVIGFSGSSSSTYASDYAVTGKFNGTTTTLGSPQLIQAGTGPYDIPDGSGRNRWGDYSEVVLDPNDHQTFWSVQEWANTVGGVGNSSWATQITAFGAQQTVTSVNSTTPNGTYGVGATISINVNFSNPVVVTGTPQLALNSGGTANYSSGSGTSTLTFTYIVTAGQNANPLDEASTSALKLNGGTINDVNSGVPALLTVPAPGTTGSLGVNNTIIIVTSAPTVTGVSSTTANGSYGVGSVIAVTIGFSNSVVVTGNPQLALNSGGIASYSSGTGTSTLTFTYTVAAGQNANPLDEASASALTLNGGTINDATSGTPAVLTLPAPGSANSLGVNKSIVIDTTAPTVTGVSSTTANGSYGVGSVITITVGWSEPVVVTGTPQLALNSGGTASYSSGSGTSSLSFTYTVAAGQNANPLDEASASALTLNGGTISDTVGTNPNAANLTLPAPGTAGSLGANKSIVIDTTAPTVTAVTSTTPDGTYGVGATITITMAWSEPVVVTGTPQLALNSGGTASYSSGSGTSTLTFTYTVAAGENSPKLDYTSTTALSLNGGTIFDTVTNPNAANLTLPAPGSAGSIGGTKSIIIDTTATSVTAVSSTTASGAYGVGSSISITVSFNNAVVVTGTPQLALNSGGTASYSTGSGTSTLTFTYIVAAGQNANPLDEASTSALTLNGGTINNASTGVAALLTLPAPGSANSLSQSNIVIDTTAPTVTAVTSTTANGSYGVGSVITITVGWSKSVVVTGTPQLSLNSGGTASYSSGSGTSTLTFTYTVAAGENSTKLDYTSTTALSLNGGTIFDTVINPNAANLTLPAPGSAGSIGGTKSIVIDTTAPIVTNVTSTTADGIYGIGGTIVITVGWSKAVVVTGTPQLALNSGGIASYSSGSGTTTLTFTYIVAAGENSPRLDYTSTTALSLNGGTIFDTVTNPNAADLTLPAPGAAGSLGANKNIQIDTVRPTVMEYDVIFGANNLTYNLIGSSRFDLPWQITGIKVVFSKPIAAADVNSLTGLTTSGLSGLGTNTLTWTISTITQGRFSTSVLNTGPDAITDAAGNSMLNPFNQNFNVLYGDFTDDGNVSSADFLGIYYAMSQPYNIFADLNGDASVDMTDVQIARHLIGHHL